MLTIINTTKINRVNGLGLVFFCFDLSFSTEGRKKQGNSKMRSIFELALA